MCRASWGLVYTCGVNVPGIVSRQDVLTDTFRESGCAERLGAYLRNTAAQSQKAVSAYFTREQILPSGSRTLMCFWGSVQQYTPTKLG